MLIILYLFCYFYSLFHSILRIENIWEYLYLGKDIARLRFYHRSVRRRVAEHVLPCSIVDPFTESLTALALASRASVKESAHESQYLWLARCWVILAGWGGRTRNYTAASLRVVFVSFEAIQCHGGNKMWRDRWRRWWTFIHPEVYVFSQEKETAR